MTMRWIFFFVMAMAVSGQASAQIDPATAPQDTPVMIAFDNYAESFLERPRTKLVETLRQSYRDGYERLIIAVFQPGNSKPRLLSNRERHLRHIASDAGFSSSDIFVRIRQRSGPEDFALLLPLGLPDRLSFEVKQGSLKDNLIRLADEHRFRNIRFTGAADCMDWTVEQDETITGWSEPSLMRQATRRHPVRSDINWGRRAARIRTETGANLSCESDTP